MRRTSVLVVSLAVLIFSACSANSASKEPASDSRSVEETRAPTESNTSSSSGTAVDTTPVPAAEPLPPITFYGHGDSVVDLGAGNDRIIVHGSASGELFVVRALDMNDQVIDGNVIVAEPGKPYEGTQMLKVPPSSVRYLQVHSDGAWQIQLLDVQAIPTVADTFAGEGSSVVAYTGHGGTARVTHEGTGIFIVLAVKGASYELLVPNTLGAYESDHHWPNGSLLVQITADGPWSVTIRP